MDVRKSRRGYFSCGYLHVCQLGHAWLAPLLPRAQSRLYAHEGGFRRVSGPSQN
jgi:hypothetical protein